MICETEFEKKIAEIMLSAMEKGHEGLKKAQVCRDGHFSPKMMNNEKLLNMRGDNIWRMILLLARTLSPKERLEVFRALYNFIINIADSYDGSYEDIIDSHAGSPIKKQ
jgi:hypothetical protein